MTPTSLYALQISVSELGGSDAQHMYQYLRSAWESPDRAYHSVQHLEECLMLARDWSVNLKRTERAALELALWFHDTVYDIRGSDNERVSAELAQRSLAKIGVVAPWCERIRDLVLATEHSASPAAGDPLTDLMLDIDLAILGADPIRFAQYQAQVRQEYSWVSESDYEKGRRQVLSYFAARAAEPGASLYRTEFGRQRLPQARINLAKALST